MAARAQANEDLKIHLRSLVDRADSSDVEFVCKDGVIVRANRIFLIGRSVVFSTMLTNGMLETASSVINLPEISSASLLPILEFLYTGDVSRYGSEDWRTGLEILSAAHFLCLPEIDSFVRDKLMRDIEIAAVASNFQRLAVMLTTGLTYKNVEHDDIILLQLVRELRVNWMNGEVVSCLSEEALEFILGHTKPTQKEEDPEFSQAEYFRFRGIMLWCVYNGLLDDSEKETNELLSKTTSLSLTENALETSPTEELNSTANDFASEVQVVQAMEASIITEAVRIVDGALPKNVDAFYNGESVKSTDVESVRRSKLEETHAQEKMITRMIKFWVPHQASKEAAARLLVHIDWVRMPVTLFVKHVEPLKLIPDLVLVHIFRFHSLHRPKPGPVQLQRPKSGPAKLHWPKSGPTKFHWLDTTHIFESDGFVIRPRIRPLGPFSGSAMCRLANRLAEELCVWRFTVEKRERGYDMQLGFVCGEGVDEAMARRVWDTEKSCSEAVRDSSTSLMTRLLHTKPPRSKALTSTLSSTFFKRGKADKNVSIDSEPFVVTTMFKWVEFRYHRVRRTCHVSVDCNLYGKIWSGLSGPMVLPVVTLDGSEARVRLNVVCGFDVFRRCK